MEYMMYQFNNVFEDLFDKFTSEQKLLMKNVCNDFSYKFIKAEENVAYVSPYIGNIPNYLCYFYNAEFKKVIQEYCEEKVNRLSTNCSIGKKVYVRRYSQNSKWVDDFQYVQVIQIKIVSTGRITFKFDDYEEDLEDMKKTTDSCFSRFQDWSVYEDICLWKTNYNFDEKKIIQKYKQFILIKAISNTVNQFEFNIYNEVIMSKAFIAMREKAYNFLIYLFPGQSDKIDKLKNNMDKLVNRKILIQDFKDFLMSEKNTLKIVLNVK